MTPERWRQLEELYDAVKNLTPSERSARLQNADPELRSSLEGILAPEGPSWSIRLGTPTPACSSQRPHLLTGRNLGPYRIQHRIGVGGMGEVFRAVDTRLGRAVALKTCREEFSERFQQEARTIASLNHPHIYSIYDVGLDRKWESNGEHCSASLGYSRNTVGSRSCFR